MNTDVLSQLDAAAIKSLLPRFVSGHIDDPMVAARDFERLDGYFRATSDEAVEAWLARLRIIGDEPVRYPADPVARGMSRTWCGDVLTRSAVEGLRHLDGDAPTVLLCNHRSYLDTQATDAALAFAGRADLADRLAAVAGPKVYADLFRRLAASCLTTLPAPQSAAVDAEDRRSMREMARLAQQAIALTHDALRGGALVVLYAEGSRTRTGRLRPFLRGVWRYLDLDGLRVVPAVLRGTERIMPVGGTQLTPGPFTLQLAPPLTGDPREVLAEAHGVIASMLPEEERPAEGDPTLV